MKIFVAPRARTLRPDVLAGALGILFSGIVLLASLVALFSGESVRLVDIFESLFPFYQLSAFGILIGVLWGILWGMILGLVIGSLYTLFIRSKSRKSAIPVFEIDPDKSVNVVQLGDQSNPQPYTIAIVANPYIFLSTYAITQPIIDSFPDSEIRQRLTELMREIEANYPDGEVTGHSDYINLLYDFFTEDQLIAVGREIVEKTEVYRSDEGSIKGTFVRDPIIEKERNFDLFAQGVSRILRAFMENELLGLPKILGPMRLIVLYDDNLPSPELQSDNALCQSLEPFDGPGFSIVDILAPRLKTETVRQYVRRRLDSADAGPATDPDVVFVLSASEELTRSTATFSVEDPAAAGCEFQISHDEGYLITRKHAFNAVQPGVAAISIWDDRLKTPVHEFAHAMSSFHNGPIVDEYIDGQGEYFEFRVNKKFLPTAGMPVPKTFTHYGLWNGSSFQLSEYFSDRASRDKPEDWRSYSASRSEDQEACIMDIAHHGYRYDKLLFDFMYDRLMAKLRRSVGSSCQQVSTARADSERSAEEALEMATEKDSGRKKR